MFAGVCRSAIDQLVRRHLPSCTVGARHFVCAERAAARVDPDPIALDGEGTGRVHSDPDTNAALTIGQRGAETSPGHILMRIRPEAQIDSSRIGCKLLFSHLMRERRGRAVRRCIDVDRVQPGERHDGTR